MLFLGAWGSYDNGGSDVAFQKSFEKRPRSKLTAH
jgi:hypothetical protein